jgi:hypothetical protein
MQFVEIIAARADTGAALPYAQATVYLTGTTTKATLFDAANQAIGNPVSALVTGAFGFAAPDGVYDIAIASADGSYSLPLIQKLQIADLAGIIGTITSGRLSYAAWAELVTITGTAGQVADVPSIDAGTHTDPAGGTVQNSGTFRYQTSPAGWHRIYDSVTSQVQAIVDAGIRHRHCRSDDEDQDKAKERTREPGPDTQGINDDDSARLLGFQEHHHVRVDQHEDCHPQHDARKCHGVGDLPECEDLAHAVARHLAIAGVVDDLGQDAEKAGAGDDRDHEAHEKHEAEWVVVEPVAP